MAFSFPKIYPILDSSVIPAENRAPFLDRLGRALTDAGVTLLEYRNKPASEAELLSDADLLRAALPAGQVKLILDDRADLVERTGFDGAHVDAGDLSPAEARQLLGPGKIIGTYGGSSEFLPGIFDVPVNYWAVGPVFTTTTKQTDKPPIGIEGVRRMRALAGPGRVLTCAAGVTLETAPLILEAGASAVVACSALFRAEDPAAEFRRWRQRLA